MSTVQSALSLPGSRNTGQDVRTQNVMAAASIANIVKSSLGPVGLDKMMVDDVGDVTITNDGATILQLLEVAAPVEPGPVGLRAAREVEELAVGRAGRVQPLLDLGLDTVHQVGAGRVAILQ